MSLAKARAVVSYYVQVQEHKPQTFICTQYNALEFLLSILCCEQPECEWLKAAQDKQNMKSKITPVTLTSSDPR